jgi:hypothetical protein
MTTPTRVYLETARKRVFACAVDWPGWCRSGKGEAQALEAFASAAPRYALVVAEAGSELRPAAGSDIDVDIVERLQGGSGTEFGVPSAIAEADRQGLDADEAARHASLVAAAWRIFDRTAAAAPAELRKGPRGGGRDTARIVGHVIEADHAYAREIGVRLPPPSVDDPAAVMAERSAMLEVLGQASDGSPLAGRRWTSRYAARRIAWHALDHAWEIEDRTDVGPPRKAGFEASL